MKSYETMSEAVNDLVKRGYDHDFNIEKEFLICEAENFRLSPDEFCIDEIYRFEGDTDPGDENIVYAISSEKKGVKGILVNAFGPYTDSLSAEIVAKLANRN
ncbi:MAG: phosphoribosylpyrophosphate synthetase [Bacteroidetes bacterium]|nr:phosphoribosylpyrophosphate synthetase [Bacteroidota bacterium]